MKNNGPMIRNKKETTRNDENLEKFPKTKSDVLKRKEQKHREFEATV